MRKFLLAAALAASVLVGLPAAASAAPAPAVTPHGGGGSTITICLPVFVGLGPKEWHCFTIQVPVQVAPPGDGCPQCGEAIDLTFDPLEFKSVATIVSELSHGYTLLGQASVSTVKGEAAKLHDAAIAQFTSVARTLGSAKMGEDQVGYVAPGTTKFNPEPSPWRQEAATDLTKAVSALQSYLLKANPTTLAAATAELDASFQVMAKNAAVPAVG